jgi:hypothetical protein
MSFSPTIRALDALPAQQGEQLDRVRSGLGAALLMEGAAGVGKSRRLKRADDRHRSETRRQNP